MRLLIILYSLMTALGASAAEVGEIAPPISLPRLDSAETVNLEDFRGTVVYLDFWASWCPPCLVSIPLINQLRNRYVEQGEAFEVVAVNVDTDPEDGIDFLLDNPVDYVVLQDPVGNTPATYDIQGMPSSFLIDAQGRIRLAHQGFRRSDIELIETELQALLEESE